jgi:hypothetical protein
LDAGSREDLSVTARLVGAALVGLEGVAGVVAGVGFVVAALAGHPTDRPVAVALGALLTLYGAAVVLVGRGIWRDRRWAGTPAMLVQFFALVVAWYQRSTLTPAAVALAVVAVPALVTLLRLAAARTDRP